LSSSTLFTKIHHCQQWFAEIHPHTVLSVIQDETAQFFQRKIKIIRKKKIRGITGGVYYGTGTVVR